MSNSDIRRRRTKWIAPLVDRPFGASLSWIDQAPLRSAKATLRAIDEMTATNCGWQEYAAGRAFKAALLDRVRSLEYLRRTRRD